MNPRQLRDLGVPQASIRTALENIQSAAKELLRGDELKETLKKLLTSPQDFVADGHFGELARELVAARAGGEGAAA
jgi:hypothetical protein